MIGGQEVFYQDSGPLFFVSGFLCTVGECFPFLTHGHIETLPTPRDEPSDTARSGQAGSQGASLEQQKAIRMGRIQTIYQDLPTSGAFWKPRRLFRNHQRYTSLPMKTASKNKPMLNPNSYAIITGKNQWGIQTDRDLQGTLT